MAFIIGFGGNFLPMWKSVYPEMFGRNSRPFPEKRAWLKATRVLVGKSALHKMISWSVEKQEYTLAAFLDIEGVFNNINSESIVIWIG